MLLLLLSPITVSTPATDNAVTDNIRRPSSVSTVALTALQIRAFGVESRANDLERKSCELHNKSFS